MCAARSLLELLLLVRNLLEQLVDRIGEQLDAIDAEVRCDLVHVDAGRSQLAQDLARTLDVFEKAGSDLAVFLERHHGLLRHGVHGLGADQLLDVHHVAVAGILGSGAGPQAPLHGCARRSKVGELGPVEDPHEGLVGHFRIGDGGFSHQLLQARAFRRVCARGDLLREQLVHRGIHAADEKAGHRGHVDRMPVLHAPLEASDEGAGDVLIHLDRKHQGDVDVEAVGDALLDRGESGIGRRDLDEDVRPPHAVEEIVRHGDRALSIVGNAWQDLDAHVAILVLRLLVDRFEHIGRQLDVLDDQVEHDLLVRDARVDQVAERVVIVTATADRLLEDGGVGGHADHGILLDHSLQLARRHQAPADVVEPDAGACLVELEQGILRHRSSYGPGAVGPLIRLSYPTGCPRPAHLPPPLAGEGRGGGFLRSRRRSG